MRGAAGDIPWGAPCWLATILLCGRRPLRTLHTRLALLSAHACWGRKAQER